MLLKIAGAATLAAGVGIASMDYVVVDVKADPDAPRIVLPVPLVAAEAALAFVPEKDLFVDVGPEAERILPVAREIAAELRTIPDTDLVTVDDGDDHVRIAKRGDRIEVHVREGDHQKVDVTVPIDCLEKALGAMHSGRVDVSRLVSALHRADGDLVRVEDGDTRVRITVW
jgi:hypothetical protein